MKPQNDPLSFAPALLLAAVMSGVGLFGGPVRSAEVATTTYIPVIINLYSNCNTTPAEAAEAVKEASRVLGQAGLKLVVVKTNNPPGAGNGDNGDLTVAEGNDVQTFGGKELTNSPGGKGIKISFVKTPEVGSTTPGWSAHRDPTIVVKKRATTNDTGQTIAHEIGHVMTLGPGHIITSNSVADAGGHTPNTNTPAGNGNIMAPSNRRNGTHLTTNQIDEIRSNRWKHGMCAVQFTNNFPAQKEQIQSGAATDRRGDATAGGSGRSLGVPGYYDLHQVFLTSIASDPLVRAEIVVNAPLTVNEAILATYGLGFDTDADPATGTPYGGYIGIDRIVFIHAEGNPAAGTLTLAGEVVDTVSGLAEPLPTPPTAFINFKMIDEDGPGRPATTTFVCDIPKALLELSAEGVPVVATTGFSSLVFDATEDLVFDTIRWQRDPLLQTFGTGVPTPGAPYPIAIAGMTPNRPFELMLDDTPVLSGVLNSQPPPAKPEA